MTKNLVICLGTGRCGSLSLSNFLNKQDSFFMVHEGRIERKKIRHLISWKNDHKNLFNWIDALNMHSGANQYYGDTGMYFLPYAESIIEKYSKVKIIGLTREKHAVAKSFMKKTEKRNHWFLHDGTIWNYDKIWDDCFPKYDEPDKYKAICIYWDEYHKMTSNLEKKYPENFKMWDLEIFNTKKGKESILNFLGYEFQRNTDINFKLNTSEKKISILNRIISWF